MNYTYSQTLISTDAEIHRSAQRGPSDTTESVLKCWEAVCDFPISQHACWRSLRGTFDALPPQVMNLEWVKSIGLPPKNNESPSIISVYLFLPMVQSIRFSLFVLLPEQVEKTEDSHSFPFMFPKVHSKSDYWSHLLQEYFPWFLVWNIVH